MIFKLTFLPKWPAGTPYNVYNFKKDFNSVKVK